MNRIILATILITVVYSWEDLKLTLVWALKTATRQKHNPTQGNQIDQIVGTALILALIPVNLVFLLITPGSILAKLAVLLTELVLVGLLAEITEIFFIGRLLPISSILIGIVSPAFHLLSQITSQSRLFFSLIRHLAFPIVFGLGLKLISDKFGSDVLYLYSDRLVGIAVAGLIISLTIQLLESFFRSNRLHLFSYFRILLGIVITVILGNYLF